MPAPDYSTGPYTVRAPSVAQVSRLNDLCFAEYPGVIEGGEPFMRWYMARPGLDPRLCQAAWHGDGLVAGLFVTRLALHLGATPRPVGVIDTVMTHPEHRRRGLAGSLLSATIRAARELGLWALQLYTAPGSAGHRLYGSLGFRDRATLRYWTRAKTDPGDPARWRPCSLADEARVQDVVASHRSHDGVPEMDTAYWAWRRHDRPLELPAATWIRDLPGGPAETVALLPATMTALGRRTVCSDLMVRQEDSVESLCAALPASTSLVALADERDHLLITSLRKADFERGSAEVAMLMSLSSPGGAGADLPWFALTESVIGV